MPGRNLNNTERRLLDRWNSGFGPSLRTVEITGTGLRGFHDLVVDFRYPLVAIAGKNGVGKSTILGCAACAYRNTTDFRTLFLERSHFNFPDFFVSGWSDTPPADVTVTWTYRQANGTAELIAARKGQSRWAGQYPRRPSRAVEFVGTIRAIHPCELRALRNHFGQNATVQMSAVSTGERDQVSRVLDRIYTDVHIAESGRHRLHHLHYGAAAYSAFNAGSGEDIVCLLSRIVAHVPNGALLVIEEIETGLHPAAQRRLISLLLDLCFERRIQVICSTHSAEILQSIPAEARVLLTRVGQDVDVRYEPTVAEVVSDLVDQPVEELVVCVEDRMARALLIEVLPASIRSRVRVLSCGSWEDALRQMAAFRRDEELGDVVGVLDGERDGRDAEHVARFRSHLGGAVGEGHEEWLRVRLRYLPGNAGPEAWIWACGQLPAFRQAVAQELNAELARVAEFFDAPAPQDLHSLAHLLGQRFGCDEERAMLAVCRAAAQSQQEHVEPIREFVAQRLAQVG